jgi:hypothetical protein
VSFFVTLTELLRSRVSLEAKSSVFSRLMVCSLKLAIVFGIYVVLEYGHVCNCIGLFELIY